MVVYTYMEDMPRGEQDGEHLIQATDSELHEPYVTLETTRTSVSDQISTPTPEAELPHLTARMAGKAFFRGFSRIMGIAPDRRIRR